MLIGISTGFGLVVLLITIFKLKSRIKYLEDTMWGMQIYIAEHTGNTMDEKKLDWYREYWKRK